jgi:hypothetical protein
LASLLLLVVVQQVQLVLVTGRGCHRVVLLLLVLLLLQRRWVVGLVVCLLVHRWLSGCSSCRLQVLLVLGMRLQLQETHQVGGFACRKVSACRQLWLAGMWQLATGSLQDIGM